MSMREKVMDASRKVYRRTKLQDVVETVVDKVEDVAKDTFSEAGDRLKARAARAGGRRPRSTTKKAKPEENHGEEVEREAVDPAGGRTKHSRDMRTRPPA